jgi:hypothetical protein
MVAYKPRSPDDDGRALSSEATAQLRAAISARWSRPQQSGDPLAAALAVAAEEARRRSLRPEELLLALKTIEEDVAVTSRVVDTEERDRFRLWLVGACMRAFFSEEPKQDS